MSAPSSAGLSFVLQPVSFKSSYYKLGDTKRNSLRRINVHVKPLTDAEKKAGWGLSVRIGNPTLNAGLCRIRGHALTQLSTK